jgi:glycosyltransferase involved in cell wall biosynthesis
LIDPDDEAGFAAAISSLLEDPVQARRLGARGRERIERFELDRLLDDIDGLYRSLLEEHDGRLPSPPPKALVGE